VLVRLRWGASTVQYRPHLPQHAANRSEDLRPYPDQQQDEDEDDHENHDWMECCESCEPYREYIFDDAQEDILNGSGLALAVMRILALVP
jgi:hypothetical protein